LIKDLPEWKIESLKNVKYGSYLTVTLILSDIKWERTLGAIVSDKLFLHGLMLIIRKETVKNLQFLIH